MNLDDIIKNLPSKETPLFKATFEKMCNAILDKVYPIGMSVIFHDNEDHSNFLGLTWERDLVGLTPIGYNPNDEEFNEIGKILGEKTHTMTIDELVGHQHTYGEGDGNMVHGGTTGEVARIAQSGSSFRTTRWPKTQLTGNTKPFNIIQPSKVVAFWKRVA